MIDIYTKVQNEDNAPLYNSNQKLAEYIS